MTKLTDEVQYHDIDGNPTTLYKLIRSEPEWAASRIQAQADDIKVLREALTEARTWVSGWASANYELGVIDKALAATE